ncbi:MAG: hypothetical protein WDM81_07855 [Rhizomicrobium sp.]
MFEWARIPYVLLVTIYLFAPYFTTQVVGDAVKGQELWAAFSSYGGFAVAIAAPFLGAGRRCRRTAQAVDCVLYRADGGARCSRCGAPRRTHRGTASCSPAC